MVIETSMGALSCLYRSCRLGFFDEIFNKQRLIEAGEKLLDYKWQLIPATAYLEYERSGNRKIMEVPYDANRQALNALMLAELVRRERTFYRPTTERSIYEL